MTRGLDWPIGMISFSYINSMLKINGKTKKERSKTKTFCNGALFRGLLLYTGVKIHFVNQRWILCLTENLDVL